MQATTFGETHKEILEKDFVQSFLKKEREVFNSLSLNRKALYDTKELIEDTSLNYLNIVPSCYGSEVLKNIIMSEYYKCESIYPYMGDLFIHSFFKSKVKKGKKFVFEKKMQQDFLSSLSRKENMLLAKWLFENACLERSININSYPGEDISIECLDEFLFDIDYDTSFTRDIPKEAKSYKYVIINGYIESVGEIHHLLTEANQTKIPYVIFCFGMNEEVKETILKNNKMGRLRVYPVSLNVNDENTLNILNDFAAIHGGHVVSSDMGESISQAVRKKLRTGKKITFTNKGIVIKPCVAKKKIELHRSFLKRRIDDAMIKTDVNVDPLKKRLKMFTGKRINVYLPDRILSDKKMTRELDYFLRFVKNIKKVYRQIVIDGQKFYIPDDCIKIIDEKVKSIENNFNNIQKIIL